MKNTIITFISLFLLSACQTEEGKKAEMAVIKAQKELDSLKSVNALKKKYYDCTIDLMLAGSSDDEACEKCKAIYYEGYYYDSLTSVDIKLDSMSK